ncbi:hypothetical protein CBI38_00190 [Rhodococcus oxybenzonivorans]|uniref:Uncharacterized protein n=1 Tax=Rhodococcus oxybenzonivorans TaxID=1990687 RepID=A0A2S2BNQ9_9NOCA|nr:hypothetical protein CBI38_00190 [Rhodococcus oxybenzonivorans]
MQNQTLHGSPPPSVAETVESPASFSRSIIGAIRTLRSGYGQPPTIRSRHRVTSDTASDGVSVEHRTRLERVSAGGPDKLCRLRLRVSGRLRLWVSGRLRLRGFEPGSPSAPPG